ncbi:Lateral flagellin [Chromobacterium subtsugae]|uniref:Flagellin n=1 Tax=Chromobacterium subtsugae TaxID=251747 RepID=A0ABS7FBK9_9NEIS|nr:MULTISPECIES: flagellin [Chromobacterium]KUM03349.1 Lateral flagellin [Chromobacterium subtsugae]KZE85929.1 Lateral flagellin [Chromobacterium sp. F49]MBW7567300.1 Lateral flagellin [Chromobacterium subtsugae]MBW8287466.1 Lateral flagellin [Chromobacterium subtsugae]OBU85174.1 Lateral flagellin [Chromobacterium subtsugae]
MLSLYTNIAALNTKSNMNSTQNALSTSMTRLGTGQRINSAMDDAAGLQIATRLDAQSRGMTVAMKNAQNGISMMQTAEGALNEVTNILQRMKDLSTEGANGTATANDKTAMQSEYDALGKELNNIVSNTTFGGEKLLAKTGGKLAAAVNFQIGASSSEVMSTDVSTQITGLDTALQAASAQYKTPSATAGGEIGSAATIDLLNTALDSVGAVRSALGANSNRLDHVVNNLNNVNNNTLAAKGRIMDTDYASESSTMTAKQMLMQASTSMLKQSGSMNSLAMSLLQ